MSESHCVLETNPLKFGTLVSIVLTFVTNLLYAVFFTTTLSTTLLNLLKLIYLKAFLVYLLSICILSTLVLKLSKSDFGAKFNVSTPVTPFKSTFAA